MTETPSSPFNFPFGAFDKDAFADFFPNQDSMGTLARGAVEASTASTRASVKGLQEAGQTVMDHMKQQIALSVETGKKLSESGTFQEALTVQTGFVKSAFENNLKGFSELSEVYADTMREAFAPLAKQAKKAAKSTASA
nr:phasin family protein [Hyphomonas sp. Mor2]